MALKRFLSRRGPGGAPARAEVLAGEAYSAVDRGPDREGYPGLLGGGCCWSSNRRWRIFLGNPATLLPLPSLPQPFSGGVTSFSALRQVENEQAIGLYVLVICTT